MQIIKRGGFFNFGHNSGLLPNDCACGNDVIDTLDKRQSHPVNALTQSKLQIIEVFFGEWVRVQNYFW